jgi:hypothetical protein
MYSKAQKKIHAQLQKQEKLQRVNLRRDVLVRNDVKNMTYNKGI